MRNEWILDVLTDLRAFAEMNGLPRLAQEFDATLRRAALELASQNDTAAAGRPAPAPRPGS